MLKQVLVLCAALPLAISSSAQNFPFSFEALPLDSANYDYSKMVDTGNYHFEHFADNSNIIYMDFYGRKEAWGGYAGFTYSNVVDTTTASFMNDRAAITGTGYNNSEKYAVCYGPSYGVAIKKLTNDAPGVFVDKVYMTNATFTALSMKNGDAFAKKFGGVTGNDPDYFLVSIFGYLSGQKKPDSVNFYLADFRFANNAQDYIVNSWKEVLLGSLGRVDSLSFTFHSSDTGIYGINTPTYFCLDQIEASLPTAIDERKLNQLSIYPNPAKEEVYIGLTGKERMFFIFDISGRIVAQGKTNHRIRISHLLPGKYVIGFKTDHGTMQSSSFIKY